MRKFLFVLCLIALTTGTAVAQKGYEKSIEAGASIGVGDYSNTSFGATMINGYRFNDYFFIGAGVGFGYSNALNWVDIDQYGVTKESRTDAYLIPVFANVKANFTKGKVSPFFRFNVGYTFDANQYIRDAPGFMVEPALGLDVKLDAKNTLYAAFGLKLQHAEYSYTRNVGALDDDWDITTKSEMLKAVSIRVGIKF